MISARSGSGTAISVSWKTTRWSRYWKRRTTPPPLYRSGVMTVLERAAPTEQSLAQEWRRRSLSLRRADDLEPLIDRIGNARFVLMGEASHGTSEYYFWRAILSLRLLEERGFNFIAVEGDWPDCYRVNR